MISCGSKSRAAYSQGRLTSFFFTLSKDLRWRSAFPWLVFRPNSLLAFSSLQHHMHIPSQEGLWWTEGSCNDVNIITKVAKNAKPVGTW